MNNPEKTMNNQETIRGQENPFKKTLSRYKERLEELFQRAKDTVKRNLWKVKMGTLGALMTLNVAQGMAHETSSLDHSDPHKTEKSISFENKVRFDVGEAYLDAQEAREVTKSFEDFIQHLSPRKTAEILKGEYVIMLKGSADASPIRNEYTTKVGAGDLVKEVTIHDNQELSQERLNALLMAISQSKNFDLFKDHIQTNALGVSDEGRSASMNLEVIENSEDVFALDANYVIYDPSGSMEQGNLPDFIKKMKEKFDAQGYEKEYIALGTEDSNVRGYLDQKEKTYTTLIETINKANEGEKIVVFTDEAPNDYQKWAELEKLAQEKDVEIKVRFFAPGEHNSKKYVDFSLAEYGKYFKDTHRGGDADSFGKIQREKAESVKDALVALGKW